MSGSSPTYNLVGAIAHFFASNRPLSFLLLGSTLFVGVFSFVLTPKQYNPEIVRPAFAITLPYQGATTEQAIDRVVYELTEKVGGVPGVDEIYVEVHDGATIGAMVIFEVGYDTTTAKVDLLSQLEGHRSLARGAIGAPHVIEINPETIPVLQVVLSGTGKHIEEVRAHAVALSQRLTRVEGVSDVSVVGGYPTALIVELDLDRLASASLSPLDVERALSSAGLRAVYGGYEGPVHTIGIVFDGRLTSPDAVGQVVVADSVRVRDVARVYRGPGTDRTYVLHQNEQGEVGEVVMLAISKVEGTSAPVVTALVRATLDEVMEDPEMSGFTYRVVSDDGVMASREVSGLTGNLVTSILIVALVLFLFLSPRAALIVLIAIPTTLLMVFAFGYLFGETINRITLFALILSLGLLVDSAIVVVENMYVHLRRAPAEVVAATKHFVIAGSVNEIGTGLLLSTATSVIVFLPVAYITGMMGPYMGPIAFFVPAALIVSLLVAVVIVPFVAMYLLRGDEVPPPFTRAIDAWVDRVTVAYQHLLDRLLASRMRMRALLLGVAGALAIALVLPLSGLVHFQMLPRADRDQFYLYLDMPVGTAIEYTRVTSEAIAALLGEHESVTTVQQFIGTAPIVDFNGMFKGAANRVRPYEATLRVNLVQGGARAQSSTEVVSALRARLSAVYPEYAPLVRFIEEPPGPPVRATLVGEVRGDDPERVHRAVEALSPFIAGVPGVVDPYVTVDAPVGDVVYTLNRERAQELGVSPEEVASVLALIGGDRYVTEYRADGLTEFTPLVMGVSDTSRDAPDDIRRFTVRSAHGGVVPLEAVVHTSYRARIPTVYFEDGSPLISITGELETRPIIYVTIDIMMRLVRGELPGYAVHAWRLSGLTLVDDAGHSIELTWGGEWEMTLENFRDLGIAMVVALALVYGVLVAQYRSFAKPGYIMVTIPLGLIGILGGFLILDQYFGVYLTATALIGFIALIGIVVNNAIILLEYVDDARREGTPLREALVRAGGARLRPIALTSLTTVLGTLTIVGDPVWSGLAWSVVCGLTLSTLLTLIVYPVLLMFFERTEHVEDISNRT